MLPLVTAIVEVALILAVLVLGIFWVRNPSGSYEPYIAVCSAVTVALDMLRRYFRSKKIRVFVSVGATYTKDQEAFVTAFEHQLTERGVERLHVGRHTEPSRQPVLEIRDLIARADAVVVLAFTRTITMTGVEKPSASLPKHKETQISNVSYPTIWNQIEAGIAFGMRKPLLMFIEDGLKQEAMLKDRLEFRALTIPLDPSYFSSVEFSSLFDDFVEKVRRRSWLRI